MKHETEFKTGHIFCNFTTFANPTRALLLFECNLHVVITQPHSFLTLRNACGEQWAENTYIYSSKLQQNQQCTRGRSTIFEWSGTGNTCSRNTAHPFGADVSVDVRTHFTNIQIYSPLVLVVVGTDYKCAQINTCGVNAAGGDVVAGDCVFVSITTSTISERGVPQRSGTRLISWRRPARAVKCLTCALSSLYLRG